MPARRTTLQWLAATALAPDLLLRAANPAAAQAPQQIDPWPDLAAQIFPDRTVADAGTMLAIDAPKRAEDAAIVPVTLRTTLAPGDSRQLRALTLVIDQNPSPLAATITVGSHGPSEISTRIRVDSYTNIHLVAELTDGQLYATKRYVKAAGGCSAPAANAQTGGPPLGTMRLRQFPPEANQPGAARTALLMVRHPNNSGMQMDQLTRLYVPAHFISELRIAADDEVLASFKLGISISENPQFRFPLPSRPIHMLRAEAHDNEGGVFKGEWPVVNSAA